MRRTMLAVLCMLLAACSARETKPESLTPPSTGSTPSLPASPTGTGERSNTTALPAPPTTSTDSTTTAPEPVFTAEILEIDEPIGERITASWHAGCPVDLEDLRLLRMTHWNLEGGVQTGELMVHADVADDVVSVFAALFDAGFPIERMELVDEYEGDDLRSMQANNTSAFNCRTVEGTNRWSEHAYGRAIDMNPLINPWVSGSAVSPPEGALYADRSLDVPGLIHDGDVVVDAFASIGWSWGGNWSSSKDYQHFSRSGR